MLGKSTPMKYDVRAFEDFFNRPKKRGRPKKKKRGRPKKKQKACKSKKKQTQIIDLTANNGTDKHGNVKKGGIVLKARLEGVIATEANHDNSPAARINWDTPENSARRKRFADSWTHQNDLYRPGDSFQNFCNRCAIHRNVLKRFLIGKYQVEEVGPTKQGRGKPSLLSKTVMRHLCEGMLTMLFKRLQCCRHASKLLQIIANYYTYA